MASIVTLGVLFEMRYLSLALCSFLLAGLAFGQGANGTITGTITDPSGAIIANAPVEARNTATGTLATATSLGHW